MRSIDQKKIKKFCVFLICTIAILLLVGLLLMAIFARPIADEYFFISEIRERGVMGYVTSQYLGWGGRLAQLFGSGIAYKIFGETGAQIAMPMIFLALFGIAWSWLISQVISFRKNKIGISLGIGFLIAGAIMYTTVCLFDVYLWLDSAIVHFLGMIMVVFDVALGIWLVRNKHRLKEKWWVVAMLLLIAFCGQTVSEVSTLLAIGWSFVALVLSCLIKKFREYRKIAILFFVVLLAGGLIMILSPGLWVRAGEAKESLSLLEILVLRPFRALGWVMESVDSWKVALLLVVAMSVKMLLPKGLSKQQRRWLVLSSVLIFISLSYFPLLVYYFGSHATGVEARILAMPSMGIFVSALILIIVGLDWGASKIKNKEKIWFTYGFVGATLLLSLVAVYGVFRFDKGYIAALSVRAAEVDLRDAEVSRYKSGAVDKLVVKDLPVMIVKSDATDFSMNNYTTIEWFYNSFLAMYDIPKEDLVVVGGKLNVAEVPDWYKEERPQICTIASVMIYPKYYCVNNYTDE